MRVSNKLRSFLIIVLSIVVVMAALPLNALQVHADPEFTVTVAKTSGEGAVYLDNYPGKTTGTYEGNEKAIVHMIPDSVCDFIKYSYDSKDYYFCSDGNGCIHYLSVNSSNHDVKVVFGESFDFSADWDGNEGTVAIAGDWYNGRALKNGTVTLTATPKEGYAFAGWKTSASDTSYVETDNPLTVNVTGASNYIACFTNTTYTIGATANNDEYGTVTGANTYNHGASVTLIATPEDGYEFDNWTKGGTQVSTDATYTFTATESGDYVANFALKTYSVTVTADPTAGGTVDGGGTFNSGETVNLTATASSGYTFVKWTDKDKGDVVSTNASYSFTAESDINLVANFTNTYYSVTATANPAEGGSISSGGANCADGVETTLTATANEGYTFTNWTENGSVIDGAGASYSFTVSGARTLVANFTLNSYEISTAVNDSAGGTVSGAGTYEHGSGVTLTATPKDGYKFVNWTKDGTQVSIDATYTFDATEAGTYTANFEGNPHTISASASPDAGGTIGGADTYKYGSNATLTATPNTGYEFVNWTENDVEVSTSASYSFTVTGDRTLVANFKLINYTISAAANDSTYGSITGAGNYDHFATATLVATPATGYHFVSWTEGGAVVENAGATYSFTVTGARNLTAQFAINSYDINVLPAENGTVVDNSGTYNHFTEITVEANPATGYHFKCWTVGGTEVSTDRVYTFTVSGPLDLVANFEINEYSIDLSSSGHGSVSGDGTYKHFEDATIVATPDEGYHFVNWTDAVTGNQVSASATYTFEVEGSRDIVANFAINSYSISVSNEDGFGKVFGGGPSFDHFTKITITATPNEGYHFVSWTDKDTGAVVSTDASYSFTVTGKKSLVANFEINMYTVTFKNDDGKILQESEFAWGTNAYYQKATPTKAPTVQFTYTFAGWDNKTTKVTEDVTYTAVYDKTVNKYVVTFVNEDGKVLQTGEVEYGTMPSYNGETPVKAATVEYTYTFAGWDQELARVQGDVTYTATYTAKKFEKGDIDYVYYKVTFNSNGGSEVVTQLVQEGYTATIPEDPMRERYNFAGWYIDEELTKPFSFSTEITADITLYAKWVKGTQEVEITYAVVGDGTVKWESGSSEGVNIVIERSQDNDKASDHFKSIQINGEDIAYFNYEITEGSATITLSTEALRDLTPGTYKVTILFDDGQAEVDLIIEGDETPTDGVTEAPKEAANDPAADTGNAPASNYLGLWIALGVVALVCVAAAPILIIKRRGLK